MKPYDFKSLESGLGSRVLTNYGVLRNFHKQAPHNETPGLKLKDYDRKVIVLFLYNFIYLLLF